MVSSYRLFSFGARVAMLETKGFSLTYFFLLLLLEQNLADWAPNYEQNFLFLFTEQMTSKRETSEHY
jgi:hypothetical protein